MLIHPKAMPLGIPEPSFISSRAAHGPRGYGQRDSDARMGVGWITELAAISTCLI